MSTEKRMNEAFDRIEEIFSQMKLLHDSTKERQEIWEKLIKEQTDNNKERLELMDRRWNNLMKVVIVFIGLFLVSFINSSISLSKRPTDKEIAKIINDGDYASKSDVMRGTESIIEDVYNTFERETEVTHEEAYVESENVKLKANRKITDYNPRGLR